MTRVLIAEDEKPARDKLARWCQDVAELEVVAQCADGLAAVRAIAETRPDVVFLDIQMPGMTGLEVAAQLERDTAPLIVFVTAYDEYAIRAFEIDAIDYLLKPYDQDRFAHAVTRVRERLSDRALREKAVAVARAAPGTTNRLMVNEGETLKLIEAGSIEALEADDNYVHVHTASKSYVLRRTLQDLHAQLGEERFVRIHKSAVVSLGAIQSLTPLFKGDYDIKLASGRELRMSRRYKDNLFARFGR
jgi:two-component system LytT family response regulator